MHVKTILRVGVGLIVWALICVQLVRVWAGSEAERPQAVAQLQAYFFGDDHHIVLRFDRELWRPRPGDPIVVDALNADGYMDLQTIGEVVEVRTANGKTDLVCWIFPHARHYVTEGSRFRAYAGPRNFEQVLDILMTPRIREAIERHWDDFRDQHEEDVKRLLDPLVNRGFDEYVAMIRPDLDAAVSAHEARFVALVERHYEASVRQDLFPLLEKHGMPLFEEKLLPVLRRLGRDLFDKAPKWHFAFQAFRDWLPGDAGRLERSFENFLREDGMPIIESYQPEIMQQLDAIGRDLSQNEEIRGLLAIALGNILEDPELGEIAKDIADEAVVRNPKTGQFLREFWQHPDTQAAVRRITGMAERYGTAVVDTILLAEGEPKRINPDLARVLRAQILWKDDFWIRLEPDAADDAVPAVRAAGGHVFEGNAVELMYPR